MLATTTIDQVRDLPIEEVIGRYIVLKKVGANYKACCPIHNENTPSFVVTPSKNIYKCFGCGNGGDAIAFVMVMENVPFYEAITIIASQHNIVIEEVEVKGKTPEQKTQEIAMADALHVAKEKYRLLLRDPKNINTYKYLRLNRNLSKASIIDWQIGLCPDWQVLTQTFINSGFTIAEKAGLLRSGNGKVYDFYHHRIVIPIHTQRGQLIGFGGRLIDGYDGAKYLNPAENDLYDKSKLLFGLDKATRNFKKHGGACLVEGYFDVIKLHQHGWDNAVATCGTALTDQQAKLLKRYTDTVFIMRDGDNAGRKAIAKDIAILAAQQFNVYVILLPEKQDPDSLFDDANLARQVLTNYVDGIEYLTDYYFAGKISPVEKAKAIEDTIALLGSIQSTVIRDQYVKSIAKKYKLQPRELTQPLSKFFQQREEERQREQEAQSDEYEGLPVWVDRKKLEIDGFVQLAQPTKGYRAGIYFLNANNRTLFKVTNFTIKPLYHIFEQSNNRRLIEVDNTVRNAVVEMPTQAFVNQGMFEVELLNKGTFRCDNELGRKEFKRITGWLLDSMPIAYELKTLGWQPEGFFAFSNRVYADGNLVEYDDLGMIRISDKYYMSLGNSKIHRDERATDNPYENDLFLKYVPPRQGMDFTRWAQLFHSAYGENACYGIAFVFLTLFKDLVTRVAKMPLLYCSGQKGSGKSAMAESITWLFFSGKDGEGNLIKGFNLNPGQSTPFSFYNRVERFRNCPILFNEFDENTNEPWKSGTFKAAYDGEGREVGDGTTGKKKQTKIQKVQGTIILVGQYMATKDDAAVSSRSIPCNFSLERLKNLTNEQQHNYNLLRSEEIEGLSGILTELLTHRPNVQKNLAKAFAEIQTQLVKETREKGHRIEARLISNYALMLSATKTVMALGITLPYSYEHFYGKAIDRMIKHNQTLKDNSIVNQFWKAVEVLFDNGLIQNGRELLVKHFPGGIHIKEGSSVTKKDAGEVLLLRFSNVYSLYAKYHRERTGQAAQNEETVLLYLKEQAYFIGLTPNEDFTDKRTSAYAFNYAAMQDMGIVLEKHLGENGKDKSHDAKQSALPLEAPVMPSDDSPF